MKSQVAYFGMFFGIYSSWWKILVFVQVSRRSMKRGSHI